jgi:hypothetical protein
MGEKGTASIFFDWANIQKSSLTGGEIEVPVEVDKPAPREPRRIIDVKSARQGKPCKKSIMQSVLCQLYYLKGVALFHLEGKEMDEVMENST